MINVSTYLCIWSWILYPSNLSNMYNTNNYQTHTTSSVPAVHHSNTAAQRSQSAKEEQAITINANKHDINRCVKWRTILICERKASWFSTLSYDIVPSSVLVSFIFYYGIKMWITCLSGMWHMRIQNRSAMLWVWESCKLCDIVFTIMTTQLPPNLCWFTSLNFNLVTNPSQLAVMMLTHVP